MVSGISLTSSILSKPLSKIALHLDIVRQAELPLEMPGRDTPVKELALGFFGLSTFDGDDVLLGRDRDFVGRETATMARARRSPSTASRTSPPTRRVRRSV
jgi:hypothetical protein